MVSVALGASAPGIDIIDDFCMRLNHQSVVKNGTLYIDGGVETFSRHQKSRILGYNTELIEVDMRTSWDWKLNISITTVNKTTNPQTGTEPPLVVRGALFSGPASDPNIYLYGGTTSFLNTSFPGFQPPASPQYALWSYSVPDTKWDQYDVTLSVQYRPAGGAYAEAPDQGLAFYLNGLINNGTSNRLAKIDNFERYLDGLIVIDMKSKSATNVSTDSLRDSPRVKGGMTYLSNVGSSGVLVAVGGVTKPSSDSSDSNDGTYVTFDQIDFLDVSSLANDNSNGTWYAQKASGDIPSGRTDFCLVSASAKDNSSHNIYMYGGKGANEAYDDIYVLSIPSFTWTKIYQGTSPRYGHTCHLVANRQMLTVGGTTSSDLASYCDWEEKGVAIFDMSTSGSSKWGSVYNAYAPAYQVPDTVYKVIGGDADGNANMNTPEHGFNTPQIANIFHQPMKSPTDAWESKDNSISGGAIAGAVVGSVAGAAAIFALVFFILLRKKKQVAQRGAMAGTGSPDMSMGAVWRNRYGRAELPGKDGQTMPPAQLQDDLGVHEMDGDPGRELPATSRED
ncbi:hypothetical protein EYZ11_000059 [Aspergillus tanneri]|uniref:Cell wall anchored protein n=1 Tax=Aspergillus tanneri TaxID=1220188 RepID=A0A4S3JY53_9EURO|nr:uncharacterized protein ATNIH1004_000634 [Aspergillus tanneri]KAA8651738.1 hypothetical protein ATNIH1004_000634 [Aspergillus tanneri]THD00495.1 hypothetical protein EYZ11_000059 [Aspergillus tanneri]